MPLGSKIDLTREKIRDWYKLNDGNVYVAFSGGKDSTVLLHLVRDLYPEVPAVFVNTGIMYPEVARFVRTIPNVHILRPKARFKDIICKHGYPVISKTVASAIQQLQSPNTSEAQRKKILYGDERGDFGKLPKKWHFLIDAPFKISKYCSRALRIYPFRKYRRATKRRPFVGLLAEEGHRRKFTYLKHGCNVADIADPYCMPLAFWTESDIWNYINEFNVPICDIYRRGFRRTGCAFCLFGIQHDPVPNRIQLLKKHYPGLHRYCLTKLGLKEVMEYLGYPYE